MATKKNTKAKTLAGIWKGSQIDEELIGEAKKYCGKIIIKEDAIKIQKQLRDEWK
jgi:hypothetical protein